MITKFWDNFPNSFSVILFGCAISIITNAILVLYFQDLKATLFSNYIAAPIFIHFWILFLLAKFNKNIRERYFVEPKTSIMKHINPVGTSKYFWFVLSWTGLNGLITFGVFMNIFPEN